MKKTTNLILLLILFASGGSLWAQYGFGTNNPNAQSAMDIQSPDKGLLIPRLGLTSSTLFLGGVTPTNDHTSMMVWNTNTATNTGLSGAGYYYWTTVSGTTTGQWTAFSTGSSLTDSATLNNTLRWDGSQWVESNALQNDGVDLTATGSMTINEHLTTKNFSTLWTTTPTIAYKVNDIVIYEGVLYKNVSSTLAASTTPSGTTNAAVWEPITGEDSSNIYSTDGTLTATRTVNLDGNFLQFSNTATSVLKIDATDNRLYIGATTTVAAAATASYTASLASNTADLDLVVEGDIKARFIVDENNQVGEVGQVLTKTASGVVWSRSNATTTIETITATATISVGTSLALIQPGANITVTLPTAGSADWPVGYSLKIKRNQAYTGTNDKVVLSGAIDGISGRSLDMGYQSITLYATAGGWIQMD